MKPKFRAWYKHDKPPLKFVSEIITDTSARFVNYEHGIQYPFEVPFIDDNFIVERFTGLCDKAGEEICEGDIFSIVRHSNLICTVEFAKLEQNNHEPVYACFALRLSHRKEIIFPFDENALENGIVIGNIHENPEILEKLK